MNNAHCLYNFYIYYEIVLKRYKEKLKKSLKNHMVDKYEIKNSTSCAKHGIEYKKA